MSEEQLKGLKASAKSLGRELQALGYGPFPHTHLLTALSRTVGFESWNALRATATQSPAPLPVELKDTDTSLPFPVQYAAATYQVSGLRVIVIHWDDRIAGLGHRYYAYDLDTGQCLTPTAAYALPANDYDVPSYEDISSLVDSLEWLRSCKACAYVVEENEVSAGSEDCPKCHRPDALVPFLKRDR